MDKLQKLFNQVVEAHTNHQNLIPLYLAYLFKQKGLKLSDNQIKDIKNQISTQNKQDEISFTLDIDEKLIDFHRLGTRQGEEFLIDWGNENDLELFLNRISEGINTMMIETIPKLSDTLLKHLKTESKSATREDKRNENTFKKSLNKQWGKTLDLLDMLLVIALDMGDNFTTDYSINHAYSHRDFVFEVLVKFHSRSCQVMKEIITLLRAGLADGAFARWRTLHEISVTSSFVSKHGQDTAERYLKHEVVESYKAAKQYMEYSKILENITITDKEIKELKSKTEDLLMLYGSTYDEPYGWAVKALGKDVNGKYRPKFSHIEKDVFLDHLRPYYQWSSDNVHAHARGLFHRLGNPEEMDDILLAGYSNIGLEEPLYFSAFSFVQITITLLLTKPTIDTLVWSNILIKLVDEIKQSILQTANDSP